MVKEEMSTHRLAMTLDSRMPEENGFLSHYKGLPRTRQKEFVRRCLLVGFDLLQQGDLGSNSMARATETPASPPRAVTRSNTGSALKGVMD